MRRLILLALLLWPSLAGAADLYVNNSGSPACDDDTTKANNTALAPWCTIGRAAWGNASYSSPSSGEAASAGDTVYITAGTYNESGPTTTENRQVALDPVNNGTSGNPITFRGVGTVEIRLLVNVRGAMIGCDGSSYIVWDHFTINDHYGGSLSDRGPVGFHFDSDHCQLLNSTVTGHGGSYFHGYATFGGNYRLISFEDGHNHLVKNNSISGAVATDGSPGEQNEGCILMYDSNDNVIEHNDIADCGSGVFVKGFHAEDGDTQNNTIIRYNRITNAFRAVQLLGSTNTRVYQNTLECRDAEGATGVHLGNSLAEGSRIVNNTIYGCNRGIMLDDTNTLVDIEVANNIIASHDSAVYGYNTASPSATDAAFTRNWYHGNTAHATWETAGATYNFATWQGTYSLDVDGVNGTDPQFTSAATGDFHIANATALTTGRVVHSIGGTNGDTIPVGAYITGTEEIGIEADPGEEPPPGTDRRFMPFSLRR